ncbi:hypothetical protein EVAR_81514_1 [Eumeta japonica]|uniref:Reverse transcriptase domain-containing protein n=1 Tax=Eumeta variegata TaxID=151549 RepID=A0A4C1VZR2_EUMVA|nr:hypothetical protein EVAR_81514_1 [Eumeta japonica]
MEHITTPTLNARAPVTRTWTSLSRLMPIVGGPQQSRKMLLSSVVTSVLTYGMLIWADAFESQESRKKDASIYRLSTIRVANAFRRVSKEEMWPLATARIPAITYTRSSTAYRSSI